MGSAVSFVLSYIMWKEYEEEEKIKFNKRRELWIKEHILLNDQELMEAEDKK